MVNPRTSTELWDDDDVDAPLHYPNATRRRALVAHSLGVLGVLGTLGLGVAAIAPHLSWITHRAHTLFAPQSTAREVARPVPQAAPPATTDFKAEPATPVGLEVAPAPVAAPVVTPPPVLTPPEPPSALAAATPSSVETAAVPPPAATPEPASAHADDSASPPASSPARALASKPVTDEPTHSAAAPRRGRTEARLTWAEIERRKARYEAWLKQQGLEEVH